MSEYDQASKIAMRFVDSAGILRWMFPKLLADYDFVRWLPTETLAYPGEPDRRCDTVAAFRHREGKSPPLAEVIEFQSGPNVNLGRLAEYGWRIHREVLLQRDPTVRYDVRVGFVNLTGPELKPNIDLGATDSLPASLSAAADGVTISNKDAAAVVEGVARGEISRAVLTLVPLMRGGGEETLIIRWQEVAGGFADAATLGFLALTFAKLTPWPDRWIESLRGWKMEESPYWREIREEGRAEGRTAGLNEGRAVGLNEGRTGQARAMLIRFIGTKFGEPVADELRPEVSRTADVAALERCLDLVLADNLAEIRKLLSATK